MDQIVHLHGVFHGQFLGNGLGKAAHDQGTGILFRKATAHQVEHGLLADAPDLCLVAHIHSVTADVHLRDGVRAGTVIQHQALAGDGRFGILRVGQDRDGAAEVGDTAIPGNGLGGDVGTGVGGSVHHLGTGVQILTGTCKGDAGEFHPGTLARQDAHGIQAGGVGTKGTGHPFDGAALFHPGTLGVQVVHVLRPVLNGGVAHPGVLADVDLHTACVQVGNVVLGGRAALNEVEVSTLVHNDEGVLKLTGTGGVQTEVRLQRDLHMHPGGHIYKGAAAPHGTMQGCKLVVGGGHQPHKMFAHHLGIGAGKGTLHIGVHYALCGYLGLDIVTSSESYCAPTPASEARSALGMPRRSKVFLMSSGTSLHLPRISVLGRT